MQPHMSHTDPWAHGWICCDEDHSASTSTSTIPTATVLDQDQDAIAVSMEAFCCTDDYCHEGSCDVPQGQSQGEGSGCCDGKVGAGSGTVTPLCLGDGSSCDLGELERWACSKEGCQAIQEYLEVCNQTDCQLDGESDQQTHSHHHLPYHDHTTFPSLGMGGYQALPDVSAWSTPNSIPSLTSTASDYISTPNLQQTAPAHHICHWQNCHRIFTCMPDLLAHVASDHLGAPGFSTPIDATPIPLVPQPNPGTNGFPNLPIPLPTQQETDQLLSCLWDDCFPLPPDCSAEMPEACPSHPLNHNQHNHVTTNGNGNGEPFSPQTMLRHVLEEHLGVPGDLVGWSADADQIPLPLSAAMDPKDAQVRGSLRHHQHQHQHQHEHHHQHQHHDRQHVQSHQHSHNHPHTHSHQHSNHHPHPYAHSHSHTHSTHFPSPPSTAKTSPVLSPTPSLTCQWPNCTHILPFPNSASLMAHLSEEHIGKGKDSYTCEFGECAKSSGGGRVFRSRQKVLRHLLSHTGHRPFVCERCGQGFSEAAPLAAHMRRHASEKPFKCEYPGCEKEFAISSSLTIHMRTHNGEKPFECPHCSKGFIEASNLTKHIRTHTGERPFACSHPNCGRKFARPDQLKRHMGVHMEKKVERKKVGVGK